MRVMHETTQTPRSVAAYRERLSPSLWMLLSAALVAPMAALVFVPVDTGIALLVGIAAASLVIEVLVWTAPVVEVRDGVLRAGRAHIPVELLGDPEQLVGEAARSARGPELGRDSWHLVRGGIDGVVRVPVADPRDPVARWVISTRTPDRLAAAILRAQRA